MLTDCRFTNAVGGTANWTFPGPAGDFQSPAVAGAIDGRTYLYLAQSFDGSQWEVGTGAYTSSSGVFARTAILFNSLGDTSKINFTTPPHVVISDYEVFGQFPFPATQVPSSDPNTLDDYEEGTWTPALTFATPGDLSVTYNSFTTGTYTKVGRLVTVNFLIVTSAFTHTTAAGAMSVTGLPFATINVSEYRAYAPLLFGGINKAGGYSSVMGAVLGNTSAFLILASGMGVAAASVVPADAPSGGAIVLGGTTSYVV